jgi:hypothetical protein
LRFTHWPQSGACQGGNDVQVGFGSGRFFLSRDFVGSCLRGTFRRVPATLPVKLFRERRDVSDQLREKMRGIRHGTPLTPFELDETTKAKR